MVSMTLAPLHVQQISNPLHNISVELGVSTEFESLKLKTCSLYHEKLLIQKFNDMITQVHTEIVSASDIMEAVKGHFHFY